jgi:hypothetical protein
MQKPERRESRLGIFQQAQRIVGKDVEATIEQAIYQLPTDVDAAMSTLKAFDATIGSMGLQDVNGFKLPGIYRPIAYVEMQLRLQNREQFSRFIIDTACGLVENVLQKIVRLGILERASDARIPLGALAIRIKKKLPPQLYADLMWLSGSIYNFAKHDYRVDDRITPDAREHYFDLDEAIAVYFIARKLVVQLEAVSGKPHEFFMKE